MEKKVVYILSQVDKAVAFEWLVEELQNDGVELVFILINDRKGRFIQDTKRQRFIKLKGSIKDIKDITIAHKPYYLIARNNDSLLIFDKTKLIYE